MTPLRLAVLSLVRRKTSTTIALLAIAISVAVSGVLLRFYRLSGARFDTLGSGGDAVVGAKAGGIEILLGSLNAEGPYPDFLPYKLFESLQSELDLHFKDGVNLSESYLDAVIPVLIFGKYRDYRVMGTDSTFLARPRKRDVIPLAAGRWASGPREIVVGADVARSGSIGIGDAIPVTPWVGGFIDTTTAVAFKVTGIMRPTHSVWDRMLYSNVAAGQDILNTMDLRDQSIWGSSVLSYVLVYMKTDGLRALQSLINRRTVAEVISIPEARKRLADLTGTGRRLGVLMTSFIMLLGGLSVAAMLVARFEAMSVQFAVLRAMGYSKREVSHWLLWEGFLLGAAACLAGGLVDALAFPSLRRMLGTALPAPEIVASHVYQSAPVWISAIAATMLAVFIPLIRLYRQDVHVSLKGM